MKLLNQWFGQSLDPSLSHILRTASIVLVLSAFGFETSSAHADVITQADTQADKEVNAPFVKVATDINTALSNKAYARITPHIHPKKGVRFSMYAYVNPETDKVFSQTNFKKYLKHSRIKFTWGEKDGTGDLYVETLPKYLSHWVVRSDEFGSAKPSVNQFQGHGNSLNNLTQVYPNADFVEFYHEGTSDWHYMDWRALRLVFETYEGRPYLVAIITDEWTI